MFGVWDGKLYMQLPSVAGCMLGRAGRPVLPLGASAREACCGKAAWVWARRGARLGGYPGRELYMRRERGSREMPHTRHYDALARPALRCKTRGVD